MKSASMTEIFGKYKIDSKHMTAYKTLKKEFYQQIPSSLAVVTTWSRSDLKNCEINIEAAMVYLQKKCFIDQTLEKIFPKVFNLFITQELLKDDKIAESSYTLTKA